MLSHTASAAQLSRVAIVIDDIGYRYSDANALNLPGNITFSILPHTPYGKKLAEQANIAHHDVLLHIPMEAENGKRFSRDVRFFHGMIKTCLFLSFSFSIPQ